VLPCISVLIVLDNNKSFIIIITRNLVCMEKSMIHSLLSIRSFVQIVGIHYEENTPVENFSNLSKHFVYIFEFVV
jgi:hypothetical protein